MRNALSIAALVLTGILAAGCSNDGPFEEAGEEIDDAVNDVEESVEDAADEVEDNTSRQ